MASKSIAAAFASFRHIEEQLVERDQAPGQPLLVRIAGKGFERLAILLGVNPYSHGSGPRISCCSSQASRYQASGAMRGLTIRFMRGGLCASRTLGKG